MLLQVWLTAVTAFGSPVSISRGSRRNDTCSMTNPTPALMNSSRGLATNARASSPANAPLTVREIASKFSEPMLPTSLTKDQPLSMTRAPAVAVGPEFSATKSFIASPPEDSRVLELLQQVGHRIVDVFVGLRRRAYGFGHRVTEFGERVQPFLSVTDAGLDDRRNDRLQKDAV